MTATNLATTQEPGVEPLLLRPEEGARALGVSRARFYQMMADGTIKTIKIGKLRRVPMSELQRYVEQQMAMQAVA